MQIPYRNVYANAGGNSQGQIPLNSTWGFCTGASVIVSATGQSSLECKIIDVQPSYIQVKLASSSSYAPVDLSAYTTALAVNQSVQLMPTDGFLSQIDPSQKVTLALLNASLHLLGTITSVGTAANNNNTAVPFYNTNQALKEMVVTVIADAACFIRPTTNTTNVADTGYELLQAGEKRTIVMGPTQGWISVIGLGASQVNLKVYRNYLV